MRTAYDFHDSFADLCFTTYLENHWYHLHITLTIDCLFIQSTIHLHQKWSSWAQWGLFLLDSLESLDSSSFLLTLSFSSSSFIIFLNYPWLFNVATSFVDGPKGSPQMTSSWVNILPKNPYFSSPPGGKRKNIHPWTSSIIGVKSQKWWHHLWTTLNQILTTIFLIKFSLDIGYRFQKGQCCLNHLGMDY